MGEKIAIAGRIQSREYQKRLSDEDIRVMTAYEVSISKLAAFDNVDNFDTEEEFETLNASGVEFEHIYD